jgi:hypothetical protein
LDTAASGAAFETVGVLAGGVIDVLAGEGPALLGLVGDELA